jgi:hypothetical protein
VPQDEHDEALSALNMKVLSESFILFLRRVGPIADAIEILYGLMTIRDTRDTLTFLAASTYVIIYQE